MERKSLRSLVELPTQEACDNAGSDKIGVRFRAEVCVSSNEPRDRNQMFWSDKMVVVGRDTIM